MWAWNMSAAWLGGGGSRPVRADIPDWVAASIMAVLYAGRPGKSMGSKKATGFRPACRQASFRLQAQSSRQKVQGNEQRTMDEGQREV